MRTFAVGLMLAVPCLAVADAGNATGAASSPARTLSVEPLTEHARLKVYPKGKEVLFRIRGDRGVPAKADELAWQVEDHLGRTLLSGRCAFGAEDWTNGVTVRIDSRKLPAGCFFLYPALESDGATVGSVMSRPAGFESFGILPDVQPLKLASLDRSRFGIQGTAWLYDDIGFDPAYACVGLKWTYGTDRPVHAQPTPESIYRVRGEDEFRKTAAYDICGRQGYASLINMHGLPAWMMRLPEHVDEKSVSSDPTRVGQAYPLAEPAAYQALLEKMMANAERRRRIVRSGMSRNWYELHWEPDWHWRGTDEEFIEFYRRAHAALVKSDPTAILTAANFGVIDTGNARLSRLFKKGLGKYIGGVTTHAYLVRDGAENGGGWPEECGLDVYIRRLRALTDHYVRPGAPILQTEGGFHFWPAKSHREALLEHACRTVRAHLIILGEGCDATFFFYLSDAVNLCKQPKPGLIDYGLFYNEDPTGRAYGPRCIAPKPTGMAVMALTRLLEGTETIGRLDAFGEGVYAYAFRRDGEVLLAMWSPAGKRHVSVPVGTGTVSRYDLFGNKTTERPSAEGTLGVDLSEEPCYLVGVNGETVSRLRADTIRRNPPQIDVPLEPVTPISMLADWSPLQGRDALTYSAEKWNGDDDFSLRYRLRVEESSACLRVDVRDDIHFMPQRLSDFWRTDCLLVSFGGGREEGSEWDRKKVIWVRLAGDGKTEFGELAGAPPKRLVPIPGLEANVKRLPKDGLTCYEVRLPFAALGVGERIRKERAFGFGLTVHDVDRDSDVTSDSHRAISVNGGCPFFMQSIKFKGVGY